MRYWLMKSEPDEMSIDDLGRAPKQTTPWFGVRNYVARNFMRDDMKVGDRAFFYHSSCPERGIAGVVEVSALAYPDASQFDRKSPYFDAKATRDAPRWFNVDVKFVEKLRLISLAELRAQPKLATLITLKRGNRLSITPVDPADWNFIVKLAKSKA
jgi:predicted RNA-binding protein with PUA-like domain